MLFCDGRLVEPKSRHHNLSCRDLPPRDKQERLSMPLLMHHFHSLIVKTPDAFVRASATNLSFVPDNGMCCVDGPADVVTKGLASISDPETSPLSSMYTTSTTSTASCAELGYTTYKADESCFTGAGLWVDDDPEHAALLKTAESEAEAKYGLEHNMTTLEMMMALQKDVCF